MNPEALPASQNRSAYGLTARSMAWADTRAIVPKDRPIPEKLTPLAVKPQTPVACYRLGIRRMDPHLQYSIVGDSTVGCLTQL